MPRPLPPIRLSSHGTPTQQPDLIHRPARSWELGLQRASVLESQRGVRDVPQAGLVRVTSSFARSVRRRVLGWSAGAIVASALAVTFVVTGAFTGSDRPASDAPRSQFESWPGSDPPIRVHLGARSPLVASNLKYGFSPASAVMADGLWHVIVQSSIPGRFVAIAVSLSGAVRSAVVLPSEFNSSCVPSIVVVHPYLVTCSGRPVEVFELTDLGRVAWRRQLVPAHEVASTEARDEDGDAFHIVAVTEPSGVVEVASWQVTSTQFEGDETEVSSNGAPGRTRPFAINVPGGVDPGRIFDAEDLLGMTPKGDLLFQVVDPDDCPLVGEARTTGKILWSDLLRRYCIPSNDFGYVATSIPVATRTNLFFELQTVQSHRVFVFSSRGVLERTQVFTTTANPFFGIYDTMFVGPSGQIDVASTLDGTACGPNINLGLVDACERIERWSSTTGRVLGVSRVNWWYQVGKLGFRGSLVAGAWWRGRVTTFSYLLSNSRYFPAHLWRAGLIATAT